MDDNKLAKLLAWFKENEIKMEPDVEIKKSITGGIGVFALRDFPEDEVLFSIPKSAVLSPNTCGISNLLDDFKIDGINGVTLAYMFELGQGENSPWFDYLQTFIGDSIPSLPRWWTADEKETFKGTEIEYMGGLDEGEVKEAYSQVIEPFISQHRDLFPIEEHHSYEGYCKALVCICSRAFEVDNFLGISLVPSADLFNHSDLENANFQSNPNVCPMCGASDYCEHTVIDEMARAPEDHQDAGANSEDEWSEQEDVDNEAMDDLVEPRLVKDLESIEEENEDESGEENEHNNGGEVDDANDEDDNDEDEDDTDYCDIVTIAQVKKGQEVFNTYGNHSNAVLLSKYGFAIWDNTEETVSLAREILWYSKNHDLKPRLKWWSTVFYQCLFGIRPDEYDPDLFEHEQEENPDEPIEIPPSPEEITWQDTAEVLSTGEITPGVLLLMNVLSATPQKFTLYKSKVSKGNYSCIPVIPSKKLLSILINKRLSRYEDGNMTSKDYKKLLDDATGRALTAVVVRGTEKLVLERALKISKAK